MYWILRRQRTLKDMKKISMKRTKLGKRMLPAFVTIIKYSKRQPFYTVQEVKQLLICYSGFMQASHRQVSWHQGFYIKKVLLGNVISKFKTQCFNLLWQDHNIYDASKILHVCSKPSKKDRVFSIICIVYIINDPVSWLLIVLSYCEKSTYVEKYCVNLRSIETAL